MTADELWDWFHSRESPYPDGDYFGKQPLVREDPYHLTGGYHSKAGNVDLTYYRTEDHMNWCFIKFGEVLHGTLKFTFSNHPSKTYLIPNPTHLLRRYTGSR